MMLSFFSEADSRTKGDLTTDVARVQDVTRRGEGMGSTSGWCAFVRGCPGKVGKFDMQRVALTVLGV